MDDLDARLRSLRPPGSDRNRPLPDRAERHLAALLSDDPVGQSGAKPVREVLVATAVVVVAVLVVMITTLRLDGGAAQAMTPPPLRYESDGQEMADIIRDATAKLGQQAGPETPLRSSRHLGWFAHIDMDAAARTPVVIAPEIIELTWYEDLSAVQTITAAEPYWADPGNRDSLADLAPAPGTVISESVFDPDEFAVPTVAVPGDTPQDLRDLLISLGMPSANAGAGDIMESIDSAMGLWTLTNPQQAALLQLLLEAGDLDALGTTSDRLGRPVVALRAEPASFPGTARILLISTDTGRIVGIETVRTTDEPPLKAGDVIAYNLWEVPQ